MIGKLVTTIALLVMLTACARGDTYAGERDEHAATAHYLANEGVMVVQGETKIVFDPLFNNTYGQYQALPLEIRAALFEGTPPYDGIDAVFISHHHGDHFDPADMLMLLREQQAMVLYAPEQAASAIRDLDPDEDILSRINAVNLAYKDAPLSFDMEGIEIEAVRIPHAGWPDPRRARVENIAWRVTLNEETTVLHMGDADPRDEHYIHDAEYWAARAPDMAFPPYWYLQSSEGKKILTTRIKAARNVGVHVPAALPDDPAARPPEYQGMDLFTEPGETRIIGNKTEQ